MKKLNQAIDRFCILHPNFGIPNLMLYVVIGNVVLGLLSNFSNGSFLSFFSYTLSGLLHGQVWRLVTFVLIPESTSPFYLLITCYFYYWIGSTLEREWGTARFNLYYWSGVLLTVIGALLASAITGGNFAVAGTSYVNLSMFLAFAVLFPDMTVLENLKIGAYLRRDKAEIAKDIQWVYSLFPRLEERSWQLAGTLSGGEQQMLAVGRALMSRPKLMMLDEPSLGLAPLVVQDIFSIIREINRQGVTVLLVEQNANMALKIADLAYVLETGTITMSGTGAELLADSRVKEAYLGKSS